MSLLDDVTSNNQKGVATTPNFRCPNCGKLTPIDRDCMYCAITSEKATVTVESDRLTTVNVLVTIQQLHNALQLVNDAVGKLPECTSRDIEDTLEKIIEQAGVVAGKADKLRRANK